MFENFHSLQCFLIFQALKSLIESENGAGFYNADKGHPIYVLGAKGKHYPEMTDGDGPDTNNLFKMLSELSRRFKKEYGTGYVWWYDFSEWQDFCKFAVESYQRNLHIQ
jgi:hypothetical protein